jgi:hypothetical protein
MKIRIDERQFLSISLSAIISAPFWFIVLNGIAYKFPFTDFSLKELLFWSGIAATANILISSFISRKDLFR